MCKDLKKTGTGEVESEVLTVTQKVLICCLAFCAQAAGETESPKFSFIYQYNAQRKLVVTSEV